MNMSKHGNKWKGGRTISSHGYVLIRLPEHPKAFATGYVYEHMLVAEKKLGRPLKKGELIHHIDSNRQNNAPENIVVNYNYTCSFNSGICALYNWNENRT